MQCTVYVRMWKFDWSVCTVLFRYPEVVRVTVTQIEVSTVFIQVPGTPGRLYVLYPLCIVEKQISRLCPFCTCTMTTSEQRATYHNVYTTLGVIISIASTDQAISLYMHSTCTVHLYGLENLKNVLRKGVKPF